MLSTSSHSFLIGMAFLGAFIGAFIGCIRGGLKRAKNKRDADLVGETIGGAVGGAFFTPILSYLGLVIWYGGQHGLTFVGGGLIAFFLFWWYISAIS